MSDRICSAEGCVEPIGKHGARGYCSGHYKRVLATGDPQAHIPFSHGRKKYESDVCYAPDCDELRASGKWCPMHHKRMWRHNSLDKPETPSGEQCWNWSKEPTYEIAHKRLNRERGSANQHLCEHCGICTADQWAYDHTDLSELVSDKGLFSLDITKYLSLCGSCHKKFDMQWMRKHDPERYALIGNTHRKEECKYGHPLSGDNLFINSQGSRRCRECKRRYFREWYATNRSAASRQAEPTEEP